MDAFALLASLPAMAPSKVNALVRAARLYQDGLWLCESEPEFTWLLLVSVIESVANEWKRDSGSSTERLEVSRPELFAILSAHADQSLLPLVAETFAESMGATRKFIDFCMAFSPGPPSLRPAEWGQFPWDEGSLRKALRLVYHYRSNALHDGRPFHAPMCEPPYSDASWPAPAERMLGLGSHQRGSTWLGKDIPFNLHCSEYIARSTILSWWRAQVPPSDSV